MSGEYGGRGKTSRSNDNTLLVFLTNKEIRSSLFESVSSLGSPTRLSD